MRLSERIFRAYCRRGAFTLVELLVVISVLGVLLALLLPVLGAAKSEARRVECSANLGQVNLGMRQYSLDNDGRIIAAREILFAPTAEEAMSVWHVSLVPYVGGGEVRNMLGDDYPEIWYCPEDRDPYPLGYHRCPHKGMTSYGLNGYYGDDEGGGEELRYGPGGGYRFSDVRRGSGCMLMMETSYSGIVYDVEEAGLAAAGVRADGHHRMTSGFYHRGRMNVLYVDGHVESLAGIEAAADERYWPGEYAGKGYMFWADMRLKGSAEARYFWGPGYTGSSGVVDE
jgi:prepilin-type processing-associated H-X9-DG protein/prepilin-type N-terminal cleavage/methylation domain-containing protein